MLVFELLPLIQPPDYTQRSQFSNDDAQVHAGLT